jgi:hypothetical protein
VVRVETHEPQPTIDLVPEGVVEARWWSAAELASTDERLAPPTLLDDVRRVLTGSL